MPETIASLYVVAVLFAFLVLILWILMPFAVFGIKGKLDELITVEKRQLEHLMRISDSLALKEEGQQ